MIRRCEVRKWDGQARAPAEAMLERGTKAKEQAMAEALTNGIVNVSVASLPAAGNPSGRGMDTAHRGTLSDEARRSFARTFVWSSWSGPLVLPEALLAVQAMFATHFGWPAWVAVGVAAAVAPVKALKTTCDEERIPAVMERSRSGSGGHLWIFFSEALPAILARQLGSYLLTKTMGKRYQMDMKSYDRLFPNQDTMPKGGFGNLIALPLQKEAAQNGNSLFIDDTGMPYNDQWAFLASIQKMELKEVKGVVDEGMRHGQIINARWSPIDENDEPWMRLPSGKKRFKIDMKDMPGKVEAVLSNRIYIKTHGISPSSA